MADQFGPHDVILRDGRTFRLRPPSAGDADALLAFFSLLSDRSLQSRFHGMPAVTAKLVEPLVEPDWVERGSLLGFLVFDGVERVAAVARWTRLRDETTAEVAFTVADELQQHGVGTRMLEQLAATAIEAGVERFIAEVLPDNKAMLNVFDGAGFEVTRCVQDEVVQVEFPIAATELYRERMDARDHVAVTASLKAFFEPASVAVIGASRRETSIGGAVFKNIIAGNFGGTVFPVNRAGASVAGVRGYSSVSAIPDPVDLAVIAVPAESVVDLAREALSAGVRALCVISAGFAEIGSEGAQRQDELLGLVRGYGARLIGPNCLGLAVGEAQLNATFAAREFPPGRIAFSSQSGALGLALL
jgi:predicted CoA-binding protein/ribosomal protein S18 acetylase RimI-like enzyme